MTFQTESLHVCEIALPASFHHGNNVIGIPKRLAATEAPITQSLDARCSTEPPDSAELGQAIQAASGTHATIAFKDPFPQMAGITTQLPFFNAPIGAKRPASGRHLEAAPPA
jgi:hypothetical protein